MPARAPARLLRLYITGDTLLHDGINAIAERFTGIDLTLFLLDEPTSGLDPARGAELMRALRALTQAGTTVVLTTHTPADADRCGKVAVLAPGGRLAFFGTPAAARAHFGTATLDEVYVLLDAAGGFPVGVPLSGWAGEEGSVRTDSAASPATPAVRAAVGQDAPPHRRPPRSHPRRDAAVRQASGQTDRDLPPLPRPQEPPRRRPPAPPASPRPQPAATSTRSAGSPPQRQQPPPRSAPHGPVPERRPRLTRQLRTPHLRHNNLQKRNRCNDRKNPPPK